MSRFLSSFKRLSRKVAKLEMGHMAGNLGPALATYNATGQLPEQPWLRAKIKWTLATAAAMAATMPGISPEEQGP